MIQSEHSEMPIAAAAGAHASPVDIAGTLAQLGVQNITIVADLPGSERVTVETRMTDLPGLLTRTGTCTLYFASQGVRRFIRYET
jgi:hypothetical protein